MEEERIEEQQEENAEELAAPDEPDAAAPQQANIDLLMDIPLAIQVRLGETRMPLRDVLGLAPGATLRLNRSENEPVDLLINGKLIATGHIIQTPEGNVGVEVNSIVTRAERLRSFG